MDRLKLIILVLTMNFSLKGQSNYQLVYQKGLPPFVGTELVASANYIFNSVENKYLKPKLFDKPNRKIRNGILNGLYRFSKTIIIDVTKDDFLKIFQHEVFGHGSRLREYGYIRNKYFVGFPGIEGGGLAFYGEAPENRIKTREEEIMIRLGGNEANMLLSNKIRNNWIENGKINLSESYFYTRNFINTNLYIRRTKTDEESYTNDIFNYYNRINELNNVGLEETSFTIDYLKKRSIINYLNPLQYYALFALIKDYIILGKEEIELPMIPIGDYKYLPLIRMGLNPFGTEFYFENFIKSKNSVNTIYFRIGDKKFHEYYGFGFKKSNIIKSNKIKLDGEIDLWKQPEMELGGEEIYKKEEKIGGSFKLGLGIKLFEEPESSYIYGLFGYKSAGYLEGEYLKEGFFTRIGIMLIK